MSWRHTPYPVALLLAGAVLLLLRVLVACGWFGIQTWIGGLALSSLMGAIWGGWGNRPGNTAIAFGVFWLIQVVIIWFGVEGVKWFEAFSAPLLIAVSLWAHWADFFMGPLATVARGFLGSTSIPYCKLETPCGPGGGSRGRRKSGFKP